MEGLISVLRICHLVISEEWAKMNGCDGGEVAAASMGPSQPLEWKFFQVFGEQTPWRSTRICKTQSSGSHFLSLQKRIELRFKNSGFGANIGIMRSRKTTVGKVLPEALGYSFYDCDTLIEQAVGETTVTKILKLHGENFFRDNESFQDTKYLLYLLSLEVFHAHPTNFSLNRKRRKTTPYKFKQRLWSRDRK